ncbi:NAD(P)/FAD-dependent oxidoreductase [Phenylobacterium sp.]|uniref:NAD(P)/FAD-dependent oxidoreductase n=1 Tax=Phenylobacterium sp. TaxID=1871053 RepID=UPI002737D54F|nr:FAD-dependent oxidoreductase [Phenylobacterium sp.]MDP3870518.1 FAD-dependent oxidoreductase [Phenylobacterium sp.]
MTGVRRLALVGAGHAHLHVIHHLDRLRAAAVEPTLIAPRQFHYSGLATGVLSGALEVAAARVDVGALAARLGVAYLACEASDIDLARRRLILDDGTEHEFDRLSLNVGSVTRDRRGLAADPGVWTAKPLDRLLDLRSAIERFLRARGRSPSVVVAGGGPSGFEIAAALAGLLERHHVVPDVSLVGAASGWAPAALITRLTRSLARRGVVVLPGEVLARAGDHCVLSEGAQRPCDMLVLATGLEAAPIIAALGLPVDGRGRLRVTPELRSINDEGVFAAGDCGVIDLEPRPMAGVFGVRAAPTLLCNLTATAAGGLEPYLPQRRWLSIMDLGDGSGLALRGRFWWQGRSALWLKRRLDVGFVARVRRTA